MIGNSGKRVCTLPIVQRYEVHIRNLQPQSRITKSYRVLLIDQGTNF